MKILFISDIHGALPRARTVFASAGADTADAVVVLGDVLYHGPRNPLPEGYDPRATAAFMNLWKHRIIAVRGNCDSEVDQTLLEFPARSDFSWLFVDGHRLFLTHGHLWHEDNMPPLNGGDVLVYGHTHVPQARERGGVGIWNPGSCSLPKEGNEPSYGLYEDGVFRVLTLDGEVVLERGLPKAGTA
ncbi:phosphodiesterase [Desulfovibrio psychrotolerans]|uniref:Phosphoesterase n=1 Tax=Desulfovibrio psychrotolerans TaxID=415242 RepID=A0A7J0BUE0_9BACT|nr:phosphodiesterase [Desulfovibrio psychrotolerans]GFM36781.1 phosphoesterase [Desulfovibrio psychrotolerans]